MSPLGEVIQVDVAIGCLQIGLDEGLPTTRCIMSPHYWHASLVLIWNVHRYIILSFITSIALAACFILAISNLGWPFLQPLLASKPMECFLLLLSIHNHMRQRWCLKTAGLIDGACQVLRLNKFQLNRLFHKSILIICLLSWFLLVWAPHSIVHDIRHLSILFHLHPLAWLAWRYWLISEPFGLGRYHLLGFHVRTLIVLHLLIVLRLLLMQAVQHALLLIILELGYQVLLVACILRIVHLLLLRRVHIFFFKIWIVLKINL